MLKIIQSVLVPLLCLSMLVVGVHFTLVTWDKEMAINAERNKSWGREFLEAQQQAELNQDFVGMRE